MFFPTRTLCIFEERTVHVLVPWVHRIGMLQEGLDLKRLERCSQEIRPGSLHIVPFLYIVSTR